MTSRTIFGFARARVDRSLRLRWRLESERAPLIRPGHRQGDGTLQAKAARQASFDCRLADPPREESEPQYPPHRKHNPDLPRSPRTPNQAWHRKEVVPTSN